MQPTSVIVSLPETAVSSPPRGTRTQYASLLYAFLGSIAIHLGALAVFYSFPQRPSSVATTVTQGNHAVRLVATIRLGVVDAVTEKPRVVPPPEEHPGRRSGEGLLQDQPPPQPAPAPTTLVKAEPAPMEHSKQSEPTPPAVASSNHDESPIGPQQPPVPSEAAARVATPSGGNVGAFTVARADYLHNPPPRYPSLARQRGWQGVTVLRVQVRTDGAADCVEVLKTSGHRMLDKVSVETVRGWKFSPARLGDSAVASWVEVPIRFQLVSS